MVVPWLGFPLANLLKRFYGDQVASLYAGMDLRRNY